MNTERQEHSTEARLLAALAHGSMMLQGIGVLVGVVVYSNQRDKSRYAAFQGLQAAVFQLITLLGVVGMWICWGIYYTYATIVLIQQIETMGDETLPTIFWVSNGSMIIPFGLMMLLGGYGLWGAWQCWQGKDFRYQIVGGWLERSGLWKKNEV